MDALEALKGNIPQELIQKGLAEALTHVDNLSKTHSMFANKKPIQHMMQKSPLAAALVGKNIDVGANFSLRSIFNPPLADYMTLFTGPKDVDKFGELLRNNPTSALSDIGKQFRQSMRGGRPEAIRVYHPKDLQGSLPHEFTHTKQDLEGSMGSDMLSGGNYAAQPIEWEANAVNELADNGVEQLGHIGGLEMQNILAAGANRVNKRYALSENDELDIVNRLARLNNHITVNPNLKKKFFDYQPNSRFKTRVVNDQKDVSHPTLASALRQAIMGNRP
jgi:hypothetical protein